MLTAAFCVQQHNLYNLLVYEVGCRGYARTRCAFVALEFAGDGGINLFVSCRIGSVPLATTLARARIFISKSSFPPFSVAPCPVCPYRSFLAAAALADRPTSSSPRSRLSLPLLDELAVIPTRPPRTLSSLPTQMLTRISRHIAVCVLLALASASAAAAAPPAPYYLAKPRALPLVTLARRGPNITYDDAGQIANITNPTTGAEVAQASATDGGGNGLDVPAIIWLAFAFAVGVPLMLGGVRLGRLTTGAAFGLAGAVCGASTDFLLVLETPTKPCVFLDSMGCVRQ